MPIAKDMIARVKAWMGTGCYCKLPHMSGVEVFKEFCCYYGERKEGADND